MSIHNLAEKLAEGDGEDFDGEGGYPCEGCGSTEFALWYWNHAPVAVCAKCQKPQEFVSWFVVEGEE